MWQQEKKERAILSLALLLSLATTPMAAPLFVPTPVLAQSATDADSFPLPETVENGTKVRIDGSTSLAAINQSLKQGFEQQFSGTNVEIAANGTDVAMSGLLDGTVDLVAIARGLTPDEQAQGLAQAQFYREKIAIIVSTDNPFQGSLTDKQFADIFRGKITNWSQLGGTEGAIRFIDRPETSDTRNTFRTYPFFKGVVFTTGSNATQIDEDNTAEIVKQLGTDGISYAMVHHVSQLPNVRVIPLNETLPDNPNYPYSQPLVYAYRQNPSPNVASFLGFILASSQQQTIEAARVAAAAAIAQSAAPTVVTPTPDPGTISAQQQPSEPPVSREKIPLWWILLPTAVLLGLLLWVFRSRLWSAGAKNNTPDDNPHDSEENDMITNNTNLNETMSENTENMLFDDSPIGSMILGEEVDNVESFATNNISNYSEIEFDEQLSPWDIEAPAYVVNTLYPQLPIGSVAIASSTEISTISEQPEVADVVFDGENGEFNDLSESAAEQSQVEPHLIEDTFSNDSRDSSGDLDLEASIWSDIEATNDTNYDESILPASSEQISDEVINSHPLPSDIAEDEVINSQPLLLDIAEDEVINSQPLLSDIAADEVINPHSLLPDITEDILNIVADAAEPIENEPVSDLPEDTDVFAEIGTFLGTGEEESTDNQGNPDVAIEVLNATIADILFDLDGQQAKFVDLPNNSESSILLKSRTPKWAYASWYISPSQKQTLENNNVSQLYLRLYDVTDLDLSDQTSHLVQQYECDDITSDRYVAIPATDHDYIAEIGYLTPGNHWELIVRSQRISVVSPPQADFWFLADVELIIHGSTQPGATVNIGGKPIKLKSDGTFHLRIPFPDDSMNYLITAIAANGEDSATIGKKFSQENSAG
ncbi:MAG TPA: substrate-binding domain-containing protein [Nodularia sp. (in: cyanobacteria)]|nr:substrate-binding domain-containing protein [Nodularia sp. (in: cyanobacteria)]